MTVFWRGLADASVETDPHAGDPRLTGRTYAIPFDRVWTMALGLASGGIPRWTLVRDDDEAGVIESECRTLVFRIRDDVRIDVGLDHNGQTRVDVTSSTRSGRMGFGRGARTIGRFVSDLDRALEATPAQILDATLDPSWME